MKIKNKIIELDFIGDKDFQNFLKLSKNKLRLLLQYFETLNYKYESTNICVKIVQEEEIKTLNKLYRKKNKITDIISFEDDGFSGDIAITISYILKNGKFSQQNFFMLLVHGMLHLFGYKHDNKSNREHMRLLENTAMVNLGLKKTHEI